MQFDLLKYWKKFKNRRASVLPKLRSADDGQSGVLLCLKISSKPFDVAFRIKRILLEG